MIPLVDLHCHLLAGLDDGPRSEEEALAMCRIAYEDGIRMAAALAHQNEQWNAVTPDRIRRAHQQLAKNLAQRGIDLAVFPCAEVMVRPQLEAAWQNDSIVSVADRRQYLLIEMPHGLTVDVRQLAAALLREGLRPILAHPERCPELLHEVGRIEDLISAGCLVQVSSASVTDLRQAEDRRALKSWFQRDIVHVMGSDAHSPRTRAPRLASAYHEVVRWAGSKVADRTFSTNAMAILHGLPLRIPPARPRRVGWLTRSW